MGGLQVVGELAVALGLGEGVDHGAVVAGAPAVVGQRLPGGEPLPVQQAGQVRVGRVVVEDEAGELSDVQLAHRCDRHRRCDPGQFVRHDGVEQALLVTEVVVDALLVHGGPPGDAVHRRAREAAGRELLHCRGFEPAAGLLDIPCHPGTVAPDPR